MDKLTEFLSVSYLNLVRFAFVALTVLIYINLRRRLLRQPKINRRLAVLDIENGSTRLPVLNYETAIGRSKACDVVIPLPSISRQHAVLTLGNEGYWRITDTKSTGGTLVNGKRLEENTIIRVGDNISLAGVNMKILPADVKISDDELKHRSAVDRVQDYYGKFPGRPGSHMLTMILLALFQFLAVIQVFLTVNEKYYFEAFMSFGILMILPWIYYIYATLMKLKNISAEMLAFFLCTLGLSVTASAAPQGMLKQLVAMVAGIVFFAVLLLMLRDLNKTMALRLFTGIASVAMLGSLLVIGTNFNGQQNWIDLGFITIQPSEIVKVLFVFTGSATLEWLLTSRNLAILTVYSAGCIGLLFLTGDFGTALIFFAAFLVLIFMTSGDLRAIALVLAAAGLGGLGLLNYKPYILDRFSLWGNVWSDVYGKGWQQTRTLMAIGSGGLLGLGSGNGFLTGVSAADTDMVFGVICEEWGLIIGAFTAAFIILLMRAAIRSGRSTRSSYYTIAACTAGTIFLFQSALNIFGSTDILPFTGVTLPFISNGGTSMMASWGLLSFITASLNYRRPEVEVETVRIAQWRKKKQEPSKNGKGRQK